MPKVFDLSGNNPDPIADRASMHEVPAVRGLDIDETVDTIFETPARSLYVGNIGGGANVVLKQIDGSSLTLTGLVAGSTVNIQYAGILASGTTATGLVAFF